jgi:hypothetical protein
MKPKEGAKMKRNLLFVTNQEDDCEAGLSYALDLAKMMGKGISLLLLRKERLMNRFETLMSAVTFAEAGEHETALQILAEGDEKAASPASDRPSSLAKACAVSGLPTQISSCSSDMVTAVGTYLKADRSIEMVLLSPSITEEKSFSSAEFKRLIRSVSRPIVTMVRQPSVA